MKNNTINKKKGFLFVVDILSIILLMIQLESTIVFIMESSSYLQYFPWDDYFDLYSIFGISDMIRRSSYDQVYIWIVFIIYFLSFYVIVVKIKDIRKKELIHGACKWFIVTNILFVLLKTIEYYIYLITITHA